MTDTDDLDAQIRKVVTIGAEAAKARKNDNNFSLEELTRMAKHMGLKSLSGKSKGDLVDLIIGSANDFKVVEDLPPVSLPWPVSPLDEENCKDWQAFASSMCITANEQLKHKITTSPLECYYLFPEARSDSIDAHIEDPDDRLRRRRYAHSLDLLVQYVWLRATNLINSKITSGQGAYLTQERFVQCIFYDILHTVLKEQDDTTNRVLAEDQFALLQLDNSKYYPEGERVKKIGVRRIDISIAGDMVQNNVGEYVKNDNYRKACFELKVVRTGYEPFFYKDIIRQAMLVADCASSRCSEYGVNNGYVVITGTSSEVYRVSLPSRLDVSTIRGCAGKYNVDLPKYIYPVPVLSTCHTGATFAVRVWRVEPDITMWLTTY